jgi:hypothetical protein
MERSAKTWDEALLGSVGSYAVVIGLAAGLTWWICACPPARVPGGLLRGLDSFLLDLSYALPVLIARFPGDSSMFLIGVALSIATSLGPKVIRRRGLTDRAFDVWLEACRHWARLPSLGVGIVRGQELARDPGLAGEAPRQSPARSCPAGPSPPLRGRGQCRWRDTPRPCLRGAITSPRT